MNRPYLLVLFSKRTTVALAVVLAVVAGTTAHTRSARAQNPFGAPGVQQAPAGKAGNPFGGGQPAGGVAGAGGAAPAAPGAAKNDEPEETDPVVLAFRRSKPTTPEKLIEAAEAMWNIRRLKESKKYLDQLAASTPTLDVLANLQRRYGTGLFMKFAVESELRPTASDLLQSVLEAGTKISRDPRRLDDLVTKLASSDESVRFPAFADLQMTGEFGAARLIRALADPNQKAGHPYIRSALIHLGRSRGEPLSLPLLIGALQSPDAATRTEIYKILGQMRSKRALPHILPAVHFKQSSDQERQAAAHSLMRIVGRVPDVAESAEYLTAKIEFYLKGGLPREPSPDGALTLWDWNPQERTVNSRQATAQAASRILAAQMATALVALDRDRAEYVRWNLVCNLEAAAFHAPEGTLAAGHPVRQMAVAAGPGPMEDVLDFAVQRSLLRAASAAAEVLGEIGQADMLRSLDGKPRTLAFCLRHRDPLLRFAAAEAILHLDPKSGFPGSSYLAQTFVSALQASQRQRVLVAHASSRGNQRMLSQLGELGFEAEVARNGHELFRLATMQPDCEMIFLSNTISQPKADELIQALRRDNRTAQIPIAVMVASHLNHDRHLPARPEDPSVADGDGARQAAAARTTTSSVGSRLLWAPPVARGVSSLVPAAANAPTTEVERLQANYARDPATLAVFEPFTPRTLATQMRRLASNTPRLGYSQRVELAQRSLDWLSRLAENPSVYDFYHIRAHERLFRQMLNHPDLTPRAAQLLGLLGSAASQKALVDIASQQIRPIDHRKVAVSAFAEAVKRRRLQLTRTEIVQQYRRYNLSEGLDRDTQKVLGRVLDIIEVSHQPPTTVTSAKNGPAKDDGQADPEMPVPATK